jgi:nucleotide-binding universal stress UspA family protein
MTCDSQHLRHVYPLACCACSDQKGVSMLETIAVAIDGTPAGQGALALAARIASKLGGCVRVLCTIDAAYALQNRPGAISQEDQIEYPEAAFEQQAAERIVADAVADLRRRGLETHGVILTGTPARAIVAEATRIGATLIVIGHRHLSWMDRFLHPPICWDVLEHAHCPVLVNIDDKRA